MLLTGNNTYSGGTTISGGALQVGNGGTSGTLGTGAINNNGTLAINRSDTLVLANDIAGSGALNQIGTGTTVLTGNNSYSGTTAITAGTLQVGDGGTRGQLGTGAVINNGALVFDRSDALTVAGPISGSGTLTQRGAGMTVLTGSNSYTGETTISSGALQIGNGGTTGTLGSGSVIDNGDLIFNRRDAITVTNAISGTGRLIQAGSGTLTLRGAEAYTGETHVQAGTLVLDGSLAGRATVDPGATLGGTGTIAGALTVAGTLMVGSSSPSAESNVASPDRLSTMALDETSLGVLGVGGNVTLKPGARDIVTVDEAGRHTTLVTNGTAAVNGATIALNPLAGAYGRVTFYPVLHAGGGLTGTATATSSNTAFDPWATSTADSLVVTLLNTTEPLALYATTRERRGDRRCARQSPERRHRRSRRRHKGTDGSRRCQPEHGARCSGRRDPRIDRATCCARRRTIHRSHSGTDVPGQHLPNRHRFLRLSGGVHVAASGPAPTANGPRLIQASHTAARPKSLVWCSAPTGPSRAVGSSGWEAAIRPES